MYRYLSITYYVIYISWFSCRLIRIQYIGCNLVVLGEGCKSSTLIIWRARGSNIALLPDVAVFRKMTTEMNESIVQYIYTYLYYIIIFNRIYIGYWQYAWFGLSSNRRIIYYILYVCVYKMYIRIARAFAGTNNMKKTYNEFQRDTRE